MNTNPDQTDPTDLSGILDRLHQLEERVARLEKSGSRRNVNIEEAEEETGIGGLPLPGKINIGLESNIGEYGLAWLGNIVLFFGITFFVQFLQDKGLAYISPVFGYISVAGIFFLAYYLRNSNSYMSKIFDLNAYLLTYYVTASLHFFTNQPVIANKALAIILLLIVSATFLFLSVRKKYTVLMGLSFVLLAVTAILSDTTHLMLLLATLVSVISIVFLFRFGWLRHVYLAIFLVYFINLLWLFNNPLMGHKMEIISIHDSGFIYIFLIAATFSLLALAPSRNELYSDNSLIAAVILNGLGFAFVVALYILSFFKTDYVPLTGSIALYCLVYSIILKIRSNWRITAAFYALFGFVTLSVTFYGIMGFPKVYFLLAIQSLLVVSMAIWFRSKFIVVMNTILFIFLLILYISTTSPGNWINISFSIVALATARILNWRKERLSIRTELIRNIYLVLAFFIVLLTLHHLVPNEYTTLSWTLVAVVYFGFSLVLKNVKYRYMALGTMIAAALYLFIVDLARIELVFRIIALLFLAMISIGLSFYYSKKLKKKEKDTED